MLPFLKDLFQSLLLPEGPSSSADSERELELATAVLLVEVMRADTNMTDAERDVAMQALQARFNLPYDALAQLMTRAQDTAKTAYDYQHFTSQLNENFTQEQKNRMVESMWEVAYADDHLHANENHVISKVAGLLHVTHGEYIAAKMRAKTAAEARTAAINRPRQ